MVEPKRKHLILYIIDIPYFIFYTLLYKWLGSVIFLPLFVTINITQKAVFLVTDVNNILTVLVSCYPRFIFCLI